MLNFFNQVTDSYDIVSRIPKQMRGLVPWTVSIPLVAKSSGCWKGGGYNIRVELIE